MKKIIIPIKPKPRFGEPCNGCGLCCMHEICSIGTMALAKLHPGKLIPDPPCPFLVLADDRSRLFCGVVLAEQQSGVAPLIQEALGIGDGCDAMSEEEQ